MYCPYCGNSCDHSHKFCYRCGKPLPEPPTTQTNPEEPVPVENTPVAVAPVTAPDETAEALPEVSAAEDDGSIPEEAGDLTFGEVTEFASADSSADPIVPEPLPKKGRLWPPVLALCVMICIGLAAFFLGGNTLTGEKSCFSIKNGVLYFDYRLYTGSDELTVPDTVDGMAVTAISDGCFQDCDRLTTIILPDSVTVIGENAFAGCDSLRGIYIPDGVMSVGAGALAECPALEAVCFPASIVEIGVGCLDECESLQYIFYDGTYAQWKELYDGTYRSGLELHTNDGVYSAQP